MSEIKISLNAKDVKDLLGLDEVEVRKGVAANIVDKYLIGHIQNKVHNKIADIISTSLNDLLLKKEWAHGGYKLSIRSPYDAAVHEIVRTVALDTATDYLERNKDTVDRIINDKINWYIQNKVREIAKVNLDLVIKEEVLKLINEKLKG